MRGYFFNSYHPHPTGQIFATISQTIVDHSDVVGASPVGNYIFILDVAPGFNGLDKDNCKMRREIFQFSLGISCVYTRGLMISYLYEGHKADSARNNAEFKWEL